MAGMVRAAIDQVKFISYELCGYMTLWLQHCGYIGSLRVLYSDHSYALIYDCWQLEADGTCHPGAESVIALSR